MKSKSLATKNKFLGEGKSTESAESASKEQTRDCS